MPKSDEDFHSDEKPMLLSFLTGKWMEIPEKNLVIID